MQVLLTNKIKTDIVILYIIIVGENMKCKNCGARVEKESSICPNCGATVNKNSDYVLLTNQSNVYEDIYSSKRKKNNKVLTKILAVILSLVIIVGAGVGSYLFFYGKNSAIDKPKLSFSSGYGVINEDEQIVYVAIKDSSSIQYIHGVNLYNGEVNEKTIKKQEAVSSDYNYTENVDNSFRCIFFDAKSLNLDKSGNYTYTFEMTFSNYNDDNRYTYYKTVNFSGNTTADVSDKVFDHSLNETTTEKTISTESTTKKEETADYIYNTYWYTAPYNDADSYSISAFKFNSDGTFTSTDYSKTGEQDWVVSTNKGEFKIDGNKLTISTSDGESDELTIDKDNQTISQGKNKLTSRKYNSIKNAEDFFGL